MRIREQFKKKLLVEGNDDQHVIWALCEKFNILETFDVVDCEGIDKLLAQLPVRLKQSEIAAIGIIIDADVNIGDRWNSIKTTLRNLNLNCPDDLPNQGLIFESDEIKLGVWIMPDNNLNGMLEDFISFLIPDNDQLLSIALETLQRIEGKSLNKYQTIHKSKALIHSWLSWQDDPGTPMGLAITKRYLTTDVEKCSQFLQWLSRLFV